ncbi:MAG: 5'/3'-nucleotidase SurE [Myxococcota bacterium]
MPRILISNDDGIHAPGIQALTAALEPHFEVWVVAPDREQSAKSHAITLDRPLRLTQVAERRFAVDGTPADSVYLAMTHLLRDQIDLVVSGINHGANLGDDIAYSGTVSAAMEAAFMGVPAVAFSLAGRSPLHFEVAAKLAHELVQQVLARGLPKRGLLNVNIPNLPRAQIKGVRATRMGHRRYNYAVHEKLDPRGKPYYWIGGDEIDFEANPGSDCDAVRDGYVSVCPLFTDLTDHLTLPTLGWVEDLSIPERSA